MRHLRSLAELTADGIETILELSAVPPQPVLAGKGAALYFEKPSARSVPTSRERDSTSRAATISSMSV